MELILFCSLVRSLNGVGLTITENRLIECRAADILGKVIVFDLVEHESQNNVFKFNMDFCEQVYAECNLLCQEGGGSVKLIHIISKQAFIFFCFID